LANYSRETGGAVWRQNLANHFLRATGSISYRKGLDCTVFSWFRKKTRGPTPGPLVGHGIRLKVRRVNPGRFTKKIRFGQGLPGDFPCLRIMPGSILACGKNPDERFYRLLTAPCLNRTVIAP